MEWKAIDSAPKDGTEVLLFMPENNIYERGCIVSHYEYGYWVNHGCLNDLPISEVGMSEPTHWMPLPEQPK